MRQLHACAERLFLEQVGDFIDMHNYVGPNAPLPTATRAAVLGEFGGAHMLLSLTHVLPHACALDLFSY